MSNPPFPLNIIGGVFHFFYVVIVNLLALLIHLLNSAHIPGALGFSIIIITVAIRFLVWPFMSSQLKVSRKMAELQPHLAALKEKHKEDKKALAEAQAALYKEHNINPAGGCVTSVIQIPIIYGLYQSIEIMFGVTGGIGAARATVQNSVNQINSVLLSPSLHLKTLPDAHFLGLDLANRPSEFIKFGWFLLLVPVVTAALQFVQSSMMVSAATVKTYPGDSSNEKKEKETADDTMAAMQGQMRIMMPLMIGFFAYNFPIGLAVYWNTFTLMGIWQQHRISGWGGVAKWFGRAPQPVTGALLKGTSSKQSSSANKKEIKVSKDTKVKIERN